MTSNSNYRSFFTAEGHLNENGTSLTVEALMLDRFSSLPGPVAAHIEECHECKEQIMGLFDIMKEQPIDRTIPHPYFDHRAAIIEFPALLRTAAMLAVALLAGTVFFLLSVRSAQNTPPIHAIHTPAPVSTDTAVFVRESGDGLLAERLTPSPNLDDLVHSEFRSEMIEVLAPETEAIVHSPITFRWKQYPRPVILKVLNNREMTVLTTNVKRNSFVTSKSFPEGLYYWKLEDNGELLFVGKFFVK
jgi:hypothetical protein